MVRWIAMAATVTRPMMGVILMVMLMVNMPIYSIRTLYNLKVL